LAGIYIHIPFCKQACYYCNFHFSTSTAFKEEMIAALIKEILLNRESNVLKDTYEIIETVYFGGGTPSLLSIEEISNLLIAIKSNHSIQVDAEITLEANPDDITMQKLLGWKGAGINRLSIGIQSFKPQDLEWMHRAHDTNQATECLALAQLAGFTNISADLIYGTPGLSDGEWHQNVNRLISAGVPHIACYALTIEPGTALDKMIALQKKAGVSSEQQARQFLLLMQWMRAAGYEHYEISNFAKPGCRSLHNSSYWQGKKYIGIGPSAHSYDGTSRRWNISNNALYIKSIRQNLIPFEVEHLSPRQRLNEYIMTSLRTINGLDLQLVESQFTTAQKTKILIAAKPYLEKNWAALRNEKLVLTDEGKLFADGIAADLFSV
jgi:oxygen-independent coproporphyrinogen III oxidase